MAGFPALLGILAAMSVKPIVLLGDPRLRLQGAAWPRRLAFGGMALAGLNWVYLLAAGAV